MVEKYFEDPQATIYCGDALETLKLFPSESIQMVMTSPPYWGLRDYGHPQQIGLEPHPDLYIKKLVEVFDEVKRVLKKEGSLWIVIGDTYFTSPTGSNTENTWIREGRLSSIEDRVKRGTKEKGWLKKKQKCLIPFRLAIALQDAGWWVRDTIVWHKPNAMPQSVKDRLSNTWELIIRLTKSDKYYFCLDTIRIPHKTESLERYQRGINQKDFGKPYQEKFTLELANEQGIDEKARLDSKKRTREKSSFSHEKPHHPKGDPTIHGQRLPPQPNQPHAFHPLGKNPGDIISTSKYLINPSQRGASPGARTLLQRVYGEKEIEKRTYSVNQKEIAQYLKEWRKRSGLTTKQIAERMGLPYTLVAHFFRTDDTGPCLPCKEDWLKLKEILGFDEKYDKVMTETFIKSDAVTPHPLGRNPTDFWNIKTQPFRGCHFAVFPERLVELPLLSTSREGDTVLDPFAGTGTVGVVARKLGRKAILIDLIPDYCRLMVERISSIPLPLNFMSNSLSGHI